MRFPPAEVFLSWPTPNYSDPVTRGNALVVVNLVFISLAVTLVIARLYTRIWIKRWFGLDDVFILLALVFTGGLTAAVLLANQQYGWDRHVYDIPLSKLKPTSQIAMAAKLLFTAAATFTRLSLFCFYYRLVADSSRQTFRWLVHLNVIYTVAIFITFIFLAIFLCNPVRNYWTFGAPADTCLDEGTATMAAGVINVTADFICTITPMPLVWQLQMPRRQRAAVIFLFSLGFFVTVAGIVRTWFIYKSLFLEYDETWYAYPLWIAAAIEIDLGVICASAPVLRPLLTHLSTGFSTPGPSIVTNNQTKGYIRSSSSDPHSSSNATRSVFTSNQSKRDSEPFSTFGKGERPEAYEMGRWRDEEQSAERHTTVAPSYFSKDVIFESEHETNLSAWDSEKSKEAPTSFEDAHVHATQHSQKQHLSLAADGFDWFDTNAGGAGRSLRSPTVRGSTGGQSFHRS